MKTLLSLVLAILVTSVASANTGKKILSFETMFGIEGGFLRDNSIRGVEGDGLPWEIRNAKGFLTQKGHLRIRIQGLVFPNIPSVPANLRGINDEEKFRAIVSCLTDDKAVRTVNIKTKGFPATRSGNSVIDTHVKLPNPCVAPIIFIIGGSEQEWFAVTGAERD